MTADLDKKLMTEAGKKLAKSGVAKNIGKVNPAMAAASAFNNIIDKYVEYKKFQEEQITKRVEIEAKRDVAIESIRSQKEIVMFTLTNIFKERGASLEKMFETLDKGIETNNADIINAALSGIVSVIKKCPFESFNDFNAKLSSGQHLLDLG